MSLSLFNPLRLSRVTIDHAILSKVAAIMYFLILSITKYDSVHR